MSEIEKRNMPKGYVAMWVAIAIAYAVWMIGWMKNLVLGSYDSLAERTVDGVTHATITGLHGSEPLFWVWTVVSVICLLLFVVYLKKILYADEVSKIAKILCIVGCIFGCVYVTWYGFFPVDMIDKATGVQVAATFADKVKFITASMIGLDYPWHFRGWGVIASATVFTNTMYCFRKYNYNNKIAVVLGSLGSAAIYMTINCPSLGEDVGNSFARPRGIAHWTGALVFAFLCAAPLVMFLFSKGRKEKGKFLAAFIIFVALLLVMLVLLVTVGKSAIIENIPMIAAYVLLFMLNFTNFFEKKKA